jgi:hypothetical protein
VSLVITLSAELAKTGRHGAVHGGTRRTRDRQNPLLHNTRRYSTTPRTTPEAGVQVPPPTTFLQAASRRWTIDTFVCDDFDPGFSTELDATQEHVVHITMFADNAPTVTRSLEITGIGRRGLVLQRTSS